LDATRVEEFLGKLADLRVVRFINEAADPLTFPGMVSIWMLPEDQPQRVLVSSLIEGSTDRYGRLEPRNVIVHLPSLVTELLAATPEQFRAPASPPSPASSGPQSSKVAPAVSMR
jgi:hypothetical protein